MTDVLITGAGGFLGTALQNRLAKEHKKTLTLTRADGDIADPKTWEHVPPARTVFHVAGRSYVPDSWQQPAEFIHTNTLGVQHALEYCRKHGAALVLASAYVYGIPEQLPISEQHPAQPNNPYALSKLLAEQLCEFAAHYRNIPVTVLRIFNIYGPGQRPEFLIPTILNYVEKREPIAVLDLLPRRDYVYLEDVVDAFMRAESSANGFRRVNIGSGESYSVQQLIHIIQKIAGTDLPVVSAQQTRKQEIPDVRADIALAGQVLDWSPKFSLEEGIKQLLLSTS